MPSDPPRPTAPHRAPDALPETECDRAPAPPSRTGRGRGHSQGGIGDSLNKQERGALTWTPAALLAAICDELHCDPDHYPTCAGRGDCTCDRFLARAIALLRQETPT